MDPTTATVDGTDIDAVATSLILDRADSSIEEDTQAADSETDALEDEQVEAGAADDETEEEVEASDTQDDDDTEDDTDLDEEPQDALYTVKVDGAERQVTLDELRRGYSGQQAIQQRMQQVADARKEVEQIYHALQTETQQVQALRHRLEAGAVTPPPSPPDDTMFKDDPIGYMEAKIAYDRQLGEWQQQQQQFQQLEQRQQQMNQQALQAHLQQELQALQAEIPEFADPQKAAQLKGKLVETGLAYGFTPEALDQITDAKAVRVLHDAMKYRELMGAKGEAERGVSQARPVVKSGAKKPAKSSKVRRQQQAAARMKKTGSVEDVANFLLS